MSTILFSGRFDPKPHAGHIITIQRLGQEYDRVIVCVLDYPKAKGSLSFRMNVLTEALSNSKGDYTVISNNIHFGKIKWADMHDLPPFTHYGTGNTKVLKHVDIEMDLSNRESVYVPRYPNYSASKEED